MTTNIPVAGTSRSGAVGFTIKNTYGILTTGGNGTIKYDDCWQFDPAGIEPDNK
jgi:hypothetical protein